jgi:hypothetical protein
MRVDRDETILETVGFQERNELFDVSIRNFFTIGGRAAIRLGLIDSKTARIAPSCFSLRSVTSIKCRMSALSCGSMAAGWGVFAGEAVRGIAVAQ